MFPIDSHVLRTARASSPSAQDEVPFKPVQPKWMDIAEDRARFKQNCIAFPELNVQYGGKKKKPDLKNF